MPILDKKDITTALLEKVNAFNNYISALNREQFESSPGGKWSAGQHLEHLIRSIKPLLLAYRLPKFLLSRIFGKTNRLSKSYEELVAKYKSKLAAGGKAVGPFIPPVVTFNMKEKLVKKYARHTEKLAAIIQKQSEENLDLYILPHPLLGKLTLREMLFFTIYHNEHHLENLKKRS